MENQTHSSRGSFTNGGIRIRDNVHGDILIPEHFRPIINSPAFQRLRRVKQLATGNYVFPGADHTRFAHSIGTFHVMQKIIAHFEAYFLELGLPDLITAKDKDQILLASLLHDLGHTPYSHALEEVLQNAVKFPHERWTTDIIQDAQDGLREIIDNFGNGVCAADVAKLILRQHQDGLRPFFSANEVNLSNIFHSLISSQLDADRMDYLRRDSISAGVSYGLIDIDRIIAGMRIGILDTGEAVVCIAEEYLSDVEGYLYARYQMYRNVYLHPYKVLTEELLRKIVRCVYELYDHDKLTIADMPRALSAALQQPFMSTNDFLSLDDYVVMGAVKNWAELSGSKQQIISCLCKALIQRRGYTRYTFLDTSKDALDSFRKELTDLFAPYYKRPSDREKPVEEQVDAFPFLVLKTACPRLYNASKDNIYILEKSGRLVEISDCSPLVRSFVSLQNEGSSLAAVTAIYLSTDVLHSYLNQSEIFEFKGGDTEMENLEHEVKKLFEKRQARNCIEIEKKYQLPGKTKLSDARRSIQSFLVAQGYTTTPPSGSEPQAVEQEDYYYDVPEGVLVQNQCSLRIRIRKGKAEITCKRPAEGSRSSGTLGQMERYEYASVLKSDPALGIDALFASQEVKDFVEKYLSDLAPYQALRQTILVKNSRTKIDVEKVKTGERYELVFDSVTYENAQTRRSHQEQQVELELKSDPTHRLNMQMLTQKLESQLAGLEMHTITKSKYERAQCFTGE